MKAPGVFEHEVDLARHQSAQRAQRGRWNERADFAQPAQRHLAELEFERHFGAKRLRRQPAQRQRRIAARQQHVERRLHARGEMRHELAERNAAQADTFGKQAAFDQCVLLRHRLADDAALEHRMHGVAEVRAGDRREPREFRMLRFVRFARDEGRREGLAREQDIRGPRRVRADTFVRCRFVFANLGLGAVGKRRETVGRLESRTRRLAQDQALARRRGLLRTILLRLPRPRTVGPQDMIHRRRRGFVTQHLLQHRVEWCANRVGLAVKDARKVDPLALRVDFELPYLAVACDKIV